MSESDWNSRQMGAWTATAMLAPLAHTAGAGWLSVALSAGAILPLCLLPGRFTGMKKPVLILEWISMVLAASVLLPAAGSCWPGNASETVVPIVLVIVAALAQDRKKSAAVAGILFWMTGVLTGFLFYMALQGMRLRWLEPGLLQWKPELLLTLLLPRLTLVLREESPGGKTLIGVTVLGTLLGLLIQGNLSPFVAAQEGASFYDLARSLRLGSLSRLEPVSALMLTLSWFASAMLLVQAGKTVLENAGAGKKTALWGTTAAMGTEIAVQSNQMIWIAVALAGISWILIPMIGCKKRSKKDEKGS